MNFWEGFSVFLVMISIALLLVGFSLAIAPFLESQTLSQPGLLYTIIGTIFWVVSIMLWNISKRVRVKVGEV